MLNLCWNYVDIMVECVLNCMWILCEKCGEHMFNILQNYVEHVLEWCQICLETMLNYGEIMSKLCWHLCWHHVEHVAVLLNLCWCYVEIMLKAWWILCWYHVQFMLKSCLMYVNIMVNLCWHYVNICWNHLKHMLNSCQHDVDILSIRWCVYVDIMLNFCQLYVALPLPPPPLHNFAWLLGWMLFCLECLKAAQKKNRVMLRKNNRHASSLQITC